MRIRELRLKAALTQDDLALQMKVDRTSVTKWECGAGLPTADKLPKLAQVLGCTIDALFEEPHEEVS